MRLREDPMANDRHIRDVMTRNPVCVSDKDSIREAARIMAREDTGVVPVVDNGKKIIGMITDRDIVVRLVAEGKDPSNAKVNEAMTKNVRSIKEDSTVADALNVMKGAEVRRVPVVNNNNEVVGIVSMGDIAKETQQHGQVGAAVKDISDAPPNN
jgi:CBS domain-containing protein